MIKESGRVVAVDADSLWVETIRQSTCNSCSAQKGCGHGLMNKASAGKSHHVRVLLGELSANEFKVDDDVDISIPEQVLVSGAMIVYLLPLVTLLAGAMLISQWWSADLMAFLGAVMGFIVGIALVRYHAYLNRNNPQLQPQVIAKRPIAQVSDVQWLNPV